MTPLLPLLALALADPSADASLGVVHATPRLPEPPQPIAAWARPAALPPREPPPPLPWSSVPVARAPHPVAWHYGRRYQELVASIMGGPRASPVFGPTVAEADVHWRLLDATGRGLDLGPEAAARWRDTAVAGTFLAAERLVGETFERAPTLYGVYVAGDTILSPSFDLRRRSADRVELSHRPGGAAARALERSEEELAFVRRGKPTPSLGMGLDWELRDEEAPGSAPLVQYTAWLATTELGLSSVRVEVAPANLAWTVSGRQILRPGLFLIGSARSVEIGPDPGRLAGGLMYVLPVAGSCNVRAERIVSYEETDERWMLSLRCENRTSAPAQLDPPLGDRGRGGPALPWVPDTRANAVAPLAASPPPPTSASEGPR